MMMDEVPAPGQARKLCQAYGRWPESSPQAQAHLQAADSCKELTVARSNNPAALFLTGGCLKGAPGVQPQRCAGADLTKPRAGRQASQNLRAWPKP